MLPLHRATSSSSLETKNSIRVRSRDLGPTWLWWSNRFWIDENQSFDPHFTSLS